MDGRTLPVLAKSANYTLTTSDVRKVIDATSNTWTLTLPAAATATDGFWFAVRNSGTGVITVDADGSETIDGATTISLVEGQAHLVICTGSAWKTVGRDLLDRVKESGGQVLTLGSVSDTQYLQRSGTTIIGATATAPAFVNQAEDLSEIEINNVNTEQTIASFTINANTLTAGKALFVRLVGLLNNNTGGTESFNLRVKFGGTEILGGAFGLATNANSRVVILEVWITCQSGGASGVVQIDGRLIYGAPGTVVGAFADFAADGRGLAGGYADLSKNLTASQALAITGQWTNASVNLTCRVETVKVYLVG